MKPLAMPPAPDLENFMFAEAAERLKESVRQGRSLDAAQVRVIGLDEIRRSAGESWIGIASRVRKNSMHFLQGCLEPGDLVIPAGDGFLVIYANGQIRDSAKQSTLLQDMLNAFYLGEQNTQRLRVEVEAIDERQLAALVSPSPALSVEDPPCRTLVFHPVWSAEQQAISSYWPGSVSPNAGRAPVRDALEHDFLNEDLMLLDHARSAAASALENGLRCLVGVSVHASTLKHRDRREEYLGALRQTPEHLRPYLPARIVEIEAGTPGIVLAEWVHYLRPVALRVVLDLHETDAGLSGLDATGAFSVSCSLPGIYQTPDAIRRAQSLIQRWAPALQRQRLKFRVDNISDSKLLTFALASGVTAFSSAIYWPPLTAPGGVKIFTQAQLRDVILRTANET